MLYSLLDDSLTAMIIFILIFNILSLFFRSTNLLISFSLLSLSANLTALLFANLGYFILAIIHLFICYVAAVIYKIPKPNFIKQSSSHNLSLNAVFLISLISIVVIYIINPSLDLAQNKEHKIYEAKQLGYAYAISKTLILIMIPILLILYKTKKEMLLIVSGGIVSGLIIGSGGLVLLSLGSMFLFITKKSPTYFFNFLFISNYLLTFSKQWFNEYSLYAELLLARFLESGVGVYLIVSDQLKIDIDFFDHIKDRLFGGFGIPNHWAILFSGYGRWSEYGGPNESTYAVAIAFGNNPIVWIYISLITIFVFKIYLTPIKRKNIFYLIIATTSYSAIQDSIGIVLLLKKALIISIMMLFAFKIIERIFKNDA